MTPETAKRTQQMFESTNRMRETKEIQKEASKVLYASTLYILSQCKDTG